MNKKIILALLAACMLLPTLDYARGGRGGGGRGRRGGGRGGHGGGRGGRGNRGGNRSGRHGNRGRNHGGYNRGGYGGYGYGGYGAGAALGTAAVIGTTAAVAGAAASQPQTVYVNDYDHYVDIEATANIEMTTDMNSTPTITPTTAPIMAPVLEEDEMVAAVDQDINNFVATLSPEDQTQFHSDVAALTQALEDTDEPELAQYVETPSTAVTETTVVAEEPSGVIFGLEEEELSELTPEELEELKSLE